MKPFQAWKLPRGFELHPHEAKVEKGPSGFSFLCGALSPQRIQELAGLLRSNREETLLSFPLARVVKSLDRVARRLLDSADPFRRATLEVLNASAGYSSAMGELVLKGMAGGWTEAGLRALIHGEFKDPSVLDGFRPGPGGSTTRALGYPLTFHLGAGSIPGVATTSVVRALLVKSAVLLRPGAGDLALPVAFLQGLEEEDPALAGNAAALYWPAEEGASTEASLRAADLVVAYGSDETIHWIRDRLPVRTPLVAYRHRMGFGLVGKRVLSRARHPETGAGAWEVAREAARSVAVFEQRGCVSPHLFFAEKGGEVPPDEWAVLLARAFGELEETLPSGVLSPADSVAIHQLRGAAEVDEALGRGRVIHGGGDSPWTVLFLPDGVVEPSCLNRTVRVIPVGRLRDALSALEPWGPFLQTVGVAGLGEEAADILEGLSRLGVSRVSPLAGVPWPPAWWHHDGGGPLRGLVRWTDVEDSELVSSGGASA